MIGLWGRIDFDLFIQQMDFASLLLEICDTSVLIDGTSLAPVWEFVIPVIYPLPAGYSDLKIQKKSYILP